MVGSYAEHDQSGIYAFELQTDEGGARLKRLYEIPGAANPSFLLMHPSGRVLYAVEELSPEGRVNVYTMEEDGPAFLEAFPSEGADPCHLSLSPDGKFLVVANYTGGSLSVFRLDENGIPVCMTEHRRHEGCSVYRGRQESPHVHFTGFADGQLYVCDLGLDRVFCYEPDLMAGSLSDTERNLQLPAGCGPRHFCRLPEHPDLLYVITEMSAEVFVFRISGKKGAAEENHFLQRIRILPEDEDAAAVPLGMIGAALKSSEDGRFLFASARIFNQIAVFAVQEDGMLQRTGVYDCGGRMPRDFGVFGDYIVTANQESGNLSVLKADPDRKSLMDTGIREEIAKPSCILRI